MADYFYDDQSKFPIVLQQRHHGLGAKFEDDSKMGWVRVQGNQGGVQPLYVVPNVPFDPVEAELAAAREHPDSDAMSTIENAPIVEFLSWGYSHRYYAYHYPDVAPYWRDNLFTESRCLLRSLQSDMSLAYEYLEGDPSLGAWMTHLGQSAKDFFQRKPLTIKPEDFGKLLDKTNDVTSRLRHATAEDYSIIHDSGIQFMRIRWEQAQLNRKVQKRINGLIETAEQEGAVAKETEDASFWLLDLAGQARFVGNPAGLAAYRCGVMVVHAGARGSGELIAGGSHRQALLAAGEMVRADFPKAVVGLLQGYMKLDSASSKSSTLQAFEEQLVGVIVWYEFFTIDFFIFKVEELPADKKSRAGEVYWEELAPELAVQIVNALVSTGMTAASNGMPANSRARKWMDRLAAALPALITSVVHEYVAMRKMADDEKRPFHEVFCAELGWALVRVLKEVGKALAEEPIKEWMKRKIEADGPVFDVNFWRALIVAIHLELATLNPKMVTVGKATPVVIKIPTPPEESESHSSSQPLKPTDKPNLPAGKGGPDQNGNIGINKFKRVAGAANPINKTKPSKPSRQKRQQVKTVPKQNIREGKEFSEQELAVAYELNSIEVLRKWREELRGKGPCYMCNNCKFVNSSKDYFAGDHVWDIQHGGDANRLTQEDFQKIAASNDPMHLYTKGVQLEILCRGCNGAKNTKFDNSPGMIPKNSGYARTKKNEDMNPDHIYHGGPEPD